MKFNPPAFGLPQSTSAAPPGRPRNARQREVDLQTVRTIAVGADAADAPATARIGSLAELPDAVGDAAIVRM